MIYNLTKEIDKERFRIRCNQLYKEQKTVELSEKKPLRSSDQNKYLHVVLGYFGLELGYSKDEVKLDFFKRKCNKDIFEQEFTNRRGQKMKRLRSTSELDTREMTLAIDRFRNFASMECGIFIPEPKKPEDEGYDIYIQQLNEMQAEITKYESQQFL